MSTDNLYIHTFSIREVHVHPVVHTVLLTFHTKGDIQYIASAALVGFWKVHREYIMFLKCQCQVSLFPLFLSILFKLHKTSHVASAFCQNAYMTRPAWSVQMSVFSWDLLWLTHYFKLWTLSLKSTNLHLLLIKTV